MAGGALIGKAFGAAEGSIEAEMAPVTTPKGAAGTPKVESPGGISAQATAAEASEAVAEAQVMKGSGGPNSVYEISGTELKTAKDYIGKTRRPVPARMADKDHRAKTVAGAPPKGKALAEDLTDEEAAGVEALLIQKRGLENLSNKISALNPALPKDKARLDAGRKVLEQQTTNE
jgi:hypothetical protein